MAFELAPLPYDYDALSPYMSRETLEYHHDKHHLAYLTNTNNFVKDLGLENESLEDIVKKVLEKILDCLITQRNITTITIFGFG